MKKVLRLSIIGALLFFSVCPSSFGAEFRLKSGDSVTGELMSYDGTTFRVKSKFGVLSVEASELSIIGLNTEEGIVDIVLGAPAVDDRDRIKGTIEYVREGEVKIKTDYGYVVVNPLEKATGIFMSEADAGKVTHQPVAGQQVVKAKGFSFALNECKKSGSATTCYFMIMSNGQDRHFTFYGREYSRLFDNVGNEYRASMSQLGDKSDDRYVKKTLPAGIPIKASISFEGISSDASLISLLEVWGYHGDRFKAEFRNVPFSK